MSLLTEMYENGECDESLYGFVKRVAKRFDPSRKKRMGKALVQRKFIRPSMRRKKPISKRSLAKRGHKLAAMFHSRPS